MACRSRSRASLCVLQQTNCRYGRSFLHVITSGPLKNHENERDHRAEHGRVADQKTRLAPGKPAPAFATAEWPARAAKQIALAAARHCQARNSPNSAD